MDLDRVMPARAGNLTYRQRRFLAVARSGTIARGTTIGLELFYGDLVEIDQRTGRYRITDLGRRAIADIPEGEW